MYSNHPPDFVAEVSSNHHRDLKRCLVFIREAARLGCSDVKFQLFRIRELFAPEILNRSKKHRDRENWELPVEFLPELAACCRADRIAFSCTPFYLEAVEQLYPYVDFYKVASYELLWGTLLAECARTGKPVVLSTGMADLDEVRDAVDILRKNGCRDLTLLHCVSGYPTPAADCNLAAIATLRREMDCPAGWSDHSVQPAVIYRAVHRFEASMIEFHLDLDGAGDEFRTGHCWLPEEIRPVIETVNTGWVADGSGKKAAVPCELPDRDWRADPDDGLRPLVATREQFVRQWT
jgi:N-acetylneuraminate synthase